MYNIRYIDAASAHTHSLTRTKPLAIALNSERARSNPHKNNAVIKAKRSRARQL